MILSVSRRTDIPAFYLEWFFNRLREGYACVRNPMNYHQVSRVEISPDVVDCIVFWTKDPAKILVRLDELRDYQYYFQVTVNGYGREIERNLPPEEQIIHSFVGLSQRLGKKKVIWRYDPILLSDKIDAGCHLRQFERLAASLGPYTERCIISFVDRYAKTERQMKALGMREVGEEQMRALGAGLADIAKGYSFRLETCSEAIDLSDFGIKPGKCIDAGLIGEITGHPLPAGKDANQRENCGCAASIDIGAYNTCRHGCRYCYASGSDAVIEKNRAEHDPASPLLLGHLLPGEKPKERKVEGRKPKARDKAKQMDLFAGEE